MVQISGRRNRIFATVLGNRASLSAPRTIRIGACTASKSDQSPGEEDEGAVSDEGASD